MRQQGSVIKTLYKEVIFLETEFGSVCSGSDVKDLRKAASFLCRG